MTQSVSLFKEPVRTIEGISEYRLENGLTVLLFPDQTTQNITVSITYLVGSRHEGRGEAGMAHLLEHMLFKGTPDQPNVKAALQNRGAKYNASTWYDRTNYYETLPASPDNLEFILQLEADRMINCWIRKEDLDTEMTVVRNEFEMAENNPEQVLMDQMFSLAYRWHNYGKTTIGNRSDIENVSITKLKLFYKHYYQPDNAVIIIAGNFDKEKTEESILQHFGKLPKPERILDSTYTQEPAQDGTRHVTLLRAGNIANASVAYHIPAASHPDFAALMVLAEILDNEPSGLLFQSLVQSELASRVSAYAFELKEPGMFYISAQSSMKENINNILNKIIQQIENLNEENIIPENIERAKARILKLFKMYNRNSHKLAIQLSESIALGDYRLFFYARDQIKMVTADDVIRVASTYFIESNRTTGLFIPTAEQKRAMISPTPDVECLLQGYAGSENIQMGEAFEMTLENIDAHTLRHVIGGTIKTSFLPKLTRGQSNRSLFTFSFGDEKTLQGHQGVLQLIPNILRRGTKKLSLQEVQDKLDQLQSTLHIYPTMRQGVVKAEITSDKDHLPEVIGLLSDLMQSPRFSQKKFDIVRQRHLTNLMKISSDPENIGTNEMERLCNPFPTDSIHYVQTFEEAIAELKKITFEETKLAYQELYGANHMDVAIVGDVHASINDVIENCFGEWRSSSPYQQITKPAIHALSELSTLYTPDKQMAFVSMGINFTMRDDDIDYPTILLANRILGTGMNSRIMQRLREKEGWSYDAGSSMEVNCRDTSGRLMLYAICATDKADAALDALKEEYHRWIETGVTENELQEARFGFQQYLDKIIAEDKFVMQSLAYMSDINRTFGYYRQMLDKIDQLQTADIKRVLGIFLSKEPIAMVKAGDFKK
jgi:zinc protease